MPSLPSHASVIVIGGGIVGCSTLYHLAKAGVRDAILLEKHQIGSGTTWHSAALVTVLRPSSTLASLARYSAKLYASLEAETGQATGWRQAGHITVAASKDRFESIKYGASVARAFDTEVQVITPDDVKSRWPLLRTDDLYGALWSPSSGRTNPSDTCQALLKGARTQGAKVFEKTPVEGFDIVGGKLKGVRTPFGNISCDTAVICAGVWTREVAGLAKVAAPLYACEHFYMLTEPMEGITADLPAIRDSDAYLYFREEVGGLLVGSFEPDPKPLPLSKLPKDASFILLNEDWDHFEPMMRNAMHRLPALETAGARTLVNGPESFTLDSTPLIGPSPEVRGLYVAAGMNSSGMVFGGGTGWVMSEWILRGQPPLDPWVTDLRRYSTINNNLKALEDRIPEVLAKHFDIAWPLHDYDSVRAVRRTPLYSTLKEHGAFFTQRAGWERPAWFAPDGKPPQPSKSFTRNNWFPFWQAEHLAARDSVALFDQSPFAKILVQGRDAEAFLQRLCAADVAMPPGGVAYTALCNEAGGMESDLTVTRLKDDAFLLITGSQQGIRDEHWLRLHLQDDEFVTLADVTSAWAAIAVTGPKARDLLSAVSPADFGNAAFPFRSAQEIEIGYGHALALRVSYAGELGWELYVPSDLAAGVLEALLAAGPAHGLRLARTAAMGSLRVEKGFRAWGHDVGPLTSPLESGLGFAVSFGKGDFLGREALLRQREAGVQRRLLSFTLDDSEVFPHGNEPLFRDGQRCGSVSSASYGHSLGRAVTLGWIGAGAMDDAALTASRYEVEIANQRHALTMHIRPPVDPAGKRLRS